MCSMKILRPSVALRCFDKESLMEAPSLLKYLGFAYFLMARRGSFQFPTMLTPNATEILSSGTLSASTCLSFEHHSSVGRRFVEECKLVRVEDVL